MGNVLDRRSYLLGDLQAFGEEVLRLRREELGLTLEQVGKRIGVSHTTVCRYEIWGAKPRDLAGAELVVESYQLDEGWS